MTTTVSVIGTIATDPKLINPASGHNSMFISARK